MMRSGRDYSAESQLSFRPAKEPSRRKYRQSSEQVAYARSPTSEIYEIIVLEI